MSKDSRFVARLSPALFAHCESVLTQWLTFSHPADKTLSHYFRAHPKLGHAERGLIAESCFAVLRHQRNLSARCAPDVTPRRLLLTTLLQQGRNLRELEHLLKKGEADWLGSVKAFDPTTLTPAERADLPDWLYARLVEQWGAEETDALARALKQAAPLDLRVNTLKGEREAVLARLEADGIPARAGTCSPYAIRLAGKPALARHPLFTEGVIEVQDEGSQLLGLLLAPRRGETVADFCAGAGGKTLLLGALMRNTGRLYAFDVSEKRLARLKPRLARSGLANVRPIRIESEHDSRLKRLAGKMDRVLVDAPCSGLGTLRRNPDLKWRQTPESVAELTQKQAAILAAAARLVRPGGRLLYATCSLLAAENDHIVDAFLAAHPEFAVVPAHTELARLNRPDFKATERLQLLPHRHDTDAFYAVLLARQEALPPTPRSAEAPA
ncbi:MAG: RsmB/NOP family class I SAM-dependent RNA methyltransferase [Zoogloeaceae bacterium]|jgi:16S rRNA (cytosine967-C5)-methyltransferase|nr:RsmB/NOP family class I SAM-dependent RNA methyltransferase [Zoogloeaceae bacterium]